MTNSVTRYILVGLLSMLSFGCIQAAQDDAMTTNKVNALIRKEVPFGSSISQVMTFLDANHVEHSDYREKEKAIYGIIHNTSGDSLVKSSITIEFHFSEQAKLKDYVVKEVFTGP